MTRGTASAHTPLFFLHLPKTGGLTLIDIMRQQYGDDAVMRLGEHEPSAAELQRLSAADWRRIRVVTGHTPFGSHPVLTHEDRCVTLLREPVERMASAYAFVRRSPEHPLASFVSRGQRFVEFAEQFVASRFDNHQVRLVSGVGRDAATVTHADLVEAKERLTRFAVVGLTDRFDESLVLLARTLRWSRVGYRPRNVRPKSDRSRSIGDDQARAVATIERFDASLYAFASGLFNARIAAEGWRFAAAAMRLRLRPSRVALRGQTRVSP